MTNILRLFSLLLKPGCAQSVHLRVGTNSVPTLLDLPLNVYFRVGTTAFPPYLTARI